MAPALLPALAMTGAIVGAAVIVYGVVQYADQMLNGADADVPALPDEIVGDNALDKTDGGGGRINADKQGVPMTDIFTFFPLESELAAVADIANPLGIFQKPGSRLLELERCNGKERLIVAVDEYGVAFKFDQARMNFFPPEEEPSGEAIASVSWDRIECLFRFDWLRPALPGEYPPGYDKIQGPNKKPLIRSSIPRSALTIAVSMVGLTFWTSKNARPIYGILEGDMPTTIRATHDPDMIERFINLYETARLEDVRSWVLDCTRWLEDWGEVKHVRVKPGSRPVREP